MFNPAPIPYRDPQLDWIYDPLPMGSVTKGWLLAKPVGVLVHWLGTSKPCRNAITGGALACSICATSPTRWIGYQPFLSYLPFRRIVFIVSRSIGTRLNVLAMPSPVEVVKSPKNRVPLSVRAVLPDQISSRTHESIAHQPQPDIRRYLLNLWQDHELIDYFNQLAGHASPAEAQAEALRASHQKKDAGVLDALLSRNQLPEVNGNAPNPTQPAEPADSQAGHATANGKRRRRA